MRRSIAGKSFGSKPSLDIAQRLVLVMFVAVAIVDRHVFGFSHALNDVVVRAFAENAAVRVDVA